VRVCVVSHLDLRRNQARRDAYPHHFSPQDQIGNSERQRRRRQDCFHWALSSSGTENSAKAFSFLNTRSDFLTVAAVAALLATPSAALGDSVSSASVAALPTRGDDVLEDHGGSILCPRAGHSAPG